MLTSSCRLVETHASSCPEVSSNLLNVHNSNDRAQSGITRSFHASAKHEILPLLAVGTIALVGRYSWKALRRMDEDWEEYEYLMEQHEKQKARENPHEHASRTMAVDVGTVYTKLAVSYPKPEVIVTREGDRFFFNGIFYTDESMDRSSSLSGRAALERYFYSENTVEDRANSKTIWSVLNPPNDGVVDEEEASKLISDLLSPAIAEAMDRLDYQSKEDLLRTVVTLPNQLLVSVPALTSFVKSLDTKTRTTFLPNPVAAVWGAQSKNLLPEDYDGKTNKTVVIDVGGETTQFSMVERNLVKYTISVPWGGESLVRLVVDLLKKESSVPLQDARSLSALQAQARAAVAELTSQTRVPVHVPYLFPDPGKHHLDAALSRYVVEQAVNHHIRNTLSETLPGENYLSTHMPPPTNLESLLMSVLTQLLEASNETPMSIDSVLVVGGASKFPLVDSSIRSACFAFMGSDANTKLVIPEVSLRTELTVLGCTTLLPSYDYELGEGLKRTNS